MDAVSGNTCRGCFLLFFALISHVLLSHGVAEGRILPHRDNELKRYLKKINKPAVKTIKSPTGELIDCVDIYKQPAFDHPLLRNHTIQMKPSFIPSDIKEEKPSGEIPQLWHLNGKCPEGTIPIQRILKKDLLRASSLESFGKKNPTGILRKSDQTDAIANNQGHDHSIVMQRGDKYYGAEASINLWNPRVNPTDFSLAQIWIVSDMDVQNTIEAGVTVNPSLYGDYETRLFIFWTRDAYKSTGCYNLICSGFVQTSTEIALNTKFSTMSIYGGTQAYVTIKIFQDKKDNNWWLSVQDKVLGYWPNELLPALGEGAKVLGWGGEVWNANFKTGSSSTTQMGNGHFPSEGLSKASFISHMQTVNAEGNFIDPPSLEVIVENPKCYGLQTDGPKGQADWRPGTYFYYGGPGKSADCP